MLPNDREREIAEAMDNGLIDIEKRGLSAEVHTEANRIFLAECLAAYRDEVCSPLYAKANEVPGLTAALAEARDSQEVLARDPGFILPAAEKLLRKAGIDTLRLYGGVVDVEQRGPGGATGHRHVDMSLALAYQGLVADERKRGGHG
jgi:hypothetical protein